MQCCRVLAALIGLAIFPVVLHAQRRIVWDRLDVEAHLDAAGALAVTETYVMDFSGDWNGGERTFNLRPRHYLAIRGAWREDDAGRHALTYDTKLDDVDDYAMVDGGHLRWRARAVTDPVFEHTKRRYVIQYVMHGVVENTGDGFRLNHDFAFPDRTDAIGAFTLKLTRAPEWQAPADFPETFTRRDIQPGDGVVVTTSLQFVGASPPAIAPLRHPGTASVLATGAGLTGLLVALFVLGERRRGRFVTPRMEVTEAFLDEHVFRHRPEVVGAAWDGQVGMPEVASVLARLELDGKLQTRAGKPNGAPVILVMTARRETFVDYDRDLIEGLFFRGRTETSPQQVQAHYRSRGFDPASMIRPSIEATLDGMFPAIDSGRDALTWALTGAGAALMVYAFVTNGLPLGVAVLVFPITFVLSFAVALAALVSNRLHWGITRVLLCLLLPLGALVGSVALGVWCLPFMGELGEPSLSPVGLWGVVLVTLGFVRSVTVRARTTMPAERLAFRTRIDAARRFFLRELKESQPALQDAWIPWMVALGLGPKVDGWAAQRPRADVTDRSDPEASARFPGPSTDSGSTSAWGGFSGGRSGGAGGGATWAAAAALASSVSVPSSSSDSSGSSYSSSDSGSSSSGGGGGGGW